MMVRKDTRFGGLFSGCKEREEFTSEQGVYILE